MSAYPNLMSPINIGRLQLPSRLVMAPIITNLANEDGSPSGRLLDYYLARLKNGVDFVNVQAVYVAEEGKGFARQLGLDRDELIPAHREFVERLHQTGAKVCIELHHGGNQAHPEFTGGKLVAPSPVMNSAIGVMPRELTIPEIKVIIQEFADAAGRAVAAGYDAVEVHGAHGYLLEQFLSPHTNKRRDKYGGSAENRARFPLEVTAAVRLRMGKEVPLLYRLSADEYLADGLTLKETVPFCKALVALGVDAIDVSGGTYESGKLFARSDDPMGVFVEAAATIKEAINSAVPVLVANRIKTPAFAEKIIASGQADLICLARGLLVDETFVARAKAVDDKDIRKCTSCNHCVAELMAGRDVTCLYNPLTGHEGEYTKEKCTASPLSLVVVGGGPAGMQAAYTAAKIGHHVTLLEAGDKLGGSIHAAAQAPLKGELRSVIIYLKKMLTKYKVDVRLNTNADSLMIAEMHPDLVLIATGATPLIPPVPGIDGGNVVLARDVLLKKVEVGQNVLVIGGGFVGIETAEYLADQNRRVTVVERNDHILGDLVPLQRQYMEERALAKMDIVTGAQITSIEGRSVLTDSGSFADIDTVVLGTGYRGNDKLNDELTLAGIPTRTIGDAARPAKIYHAIQSGFKAAYYLDDYYQEAKDNLRDQQVRIVAKTVSVVLKAHRNK